MLVAEKKVKHGHHRASRHVLALENKTVRVEKRRRWTAERFFDIGLKRKIVDFQDELKCQKVFSVSRMNVSRAKEQLLNAEKALESEIAKFSIGKLAVFLFVVFAIIAPFKAYYFLSGASFFKGKVLGAASNGAVEMIDGAKAAMALDFLAASGDFADANNYFSAAIEDIGEISKIADLANNITPLKKLGMVANSGVMLDAGKMSAQIGNQLADMGDFVKQNKGSGFGVILEGVSARLAEINLSVRRLGLLLDQVDIASLPNEYQEKITVILTHKDSLTAIADEAAVASAGLNKIAGNEGLKRYLFVFQNNAEMRGAGGFIGSFALIDVEKGKIKNIEIPTGGSYDVEAGMLKRVAAPVPLRNLRARWYFWDANWWPDWSKSAEKLAWFYENSGGPTVDGVISVTPTFVERLLDLTGSIYLPEQDISVDSLNFWLIAQTFSEQKKNQTVVACIEKGPETLIFSDIGAGRYLCVNNAEGVNEKPKKIIGILFTAIKDRLESQASTMDKTAIFKLLDDGFAEKFIAAHVREGGEFLEILKWQNVISSEISDDYLLVAHTNIGGGKSDRDISNAVSLQSEISDSGEIVNTLKISRSFKEIKESHYATNNNFDWLRVYVPAGSQLLSADGFARPPEKFFSGQTCLNCTIDPDLAAEEFGSTTVVDNGTVIYSESGKTVFANWFALKAGEKRTVTLKYKLPMNTVSHEGKYKMIIQKQAGLSESPYDFKVMKNGELKYKNNINLKKDEYLIF